MNYYSIVDQVMESRKEELISIFCSLKDQRDCFRNMLIRFASDISYDFSTSELVYHLNEFLDDHESIIRRCDIRKGVLPIFEVAA